MVLVVNNQTATTVCQQIQVVQFRPSSSTLTFLASDCAPSLPKICSVWPHLGHWYKLMFCTMPSTGTLTLRNISVPLRASSSAMSCGVVTMTAPTVSTTTTMCLSRCLSVCLSHSGMCQNGPLVILWEVSAGRYTHPSLLWGPTALLIQGRIPHWVVRHTYHTHTYSQHHCATGDTDRQVTGGRGTAGKDMTREIWFSVWNYIKVGWYLPPVRFSPLVIILYY